MSNIRIEFEHKSDFSSLFLGYIIFSLDGHLPVPFGMGDNASVTTYNRAEKIDDAANSMVTFK